MAILTPSPRALACLLALACAMGQPSEVSAQPPLVLEYRVKAAYLYNFAKFVEWPGATLQSGAPIVLGVVGASPFKSIAEHTVGGKTIDGRPLVVRQIARSAEMTACHILFVPASEKKRLAQIVQSAGDTPLLTVGEDEEFVPAGGMVNFTIEQDRVRFQVNLDAVDRAGLKISSKLLSLATRVHQGSRRARN